MQAARLLNGNVPEVIVKRGRKGGVLITEDAAWSAVLGGEDLKVVSTVGAGDAFLAGALAAAQDDRGPEERLASAVAAGAASVLADTVGQLDRTVYETFLAAVDVREADIR